MTLTGSRLCWQRSRLVSFYIPILTLFGFGITGLISCEMAFMHKKSQGPVLMRCHMMMWWFYVLALKLMYNFYFQFVQRAAVVRQELAKLKKSAS